MVRSVRNGGKGEDELVESTSPIGSGIVLVINGEADGDLKGTKLV